MSLSIGLHIVVHKKIEIQLSVKKLKLKKYLLQVKIWFFIKFKISDENKILYFCCLEF